MSTLLLLAELHSRVPSLPSKKRAAESQASPEARVKWARSEADDLDAIWGVRAASPDLLD